MIRMLQTVSSYFATFSKAMDQQIRKDLPVYLVIAVYVAAGMGYLAWNGIFSWNAFGIYTAKWGFMFAAFMPVIALCFDAAMIIHRFDSRRRLAFKQVFHATRLAKLAAGILLLMVLSFLQATFTAVKTGFPIIQGGFSYDRTHADIDQWLHFGIDPWRWLAPWFNVDWIRTAVEINYNVLWFILCFAFLFFVVTSPKAAHIRGRFLVCFCLCWIVVGNVLAGAYLSAGPVYYGYVTGDEERFADQIAFLRMGLGHASSAAGYQEYLWRLYEAGKADFASGISAFPSMHVSLIVLTALFLVELNLKLATPLIAYVLFVMASSVYLGWHYAIDGYASLVVTVALYWAVNAVVRLHLAESSRLPLTPVPRPTITTF